MAVPVRLLLSCQLMGTSLLQMIEDAPEERGGGPLSMRRCIGTGEWCRVQLGIHATKGQKFAVKEYEKGRLIWLKCIQFALNELAVLRQCACSFIANALHAYQTRLSLCLVLEYCSRGSLRQQYASGLCLDEAQLRFLAAGVLLGLEHIHTNGIIHHGISPQNILFTKKSYPKICGFSKASFWRPNNESDCQGNIAYMAPEVLAGQPHGIAADYYSLGAVLFQAASSFRPYRSTTKNELRNEILTRQARIKPGDAPGFSEQCLDLINKLIQRKAAYRLGSTGPESVKKHPWFLGVDFHELEEGLVVSPLQLRRVGRFKAGTLRQVPPEFGTLVGKEEIQSLFKQYRLSRVGL